MSKAHRPGTAPPSTPQRSGRWAGKLVCACCIALALFAVGVDAHSTAVLLRKVAGIETLDVPERSLPAHPHAHRHSSVLLHSALDARWYVLYAEKILRGETWRVRWNGLDNAPHGREVHWSSAVVWAIAGTARLIACFSGRPALDEVQNAPFYLGPLLFLPCALLLAWLVGRRFGWGPAGLMVLLFATSFPVYDLFRAGEADHHGIATVLTVGAVFALVAGGVGTARRTPEPPAHLARDTATWFRLSGLLGAAGMWVSASTLVPVLAACGAGALLAMIAGRFVGRSLAIRPAAWWQWGLWGCGGSLFFYLLEYFPAHMGWRLEVNHPLFACAWLGGGFFLRRCGEWLAGAPFAGRTTASRLALVAALAALLAPLMVVGVFSTRVFTVADRFLLKLHAQYIREFAPACVAYAGPEWFAHCVDVGWWAVLASAGFSVLWMWRRSLSREWIPQGVFLLVVALFLQGEALVQVRWAGLSVGMWVVCVVWLTGVYQCERRALHLPRTLVVAGVLWLLLGTTGLPLHSLRALAALKKEPETLPKMMVPTVLLRDIAHRIVAASPQRLPVVLSDPTSSSDLAYYGGVQVVGTLYWENVEGLKRSAHIFSAQTEAEARRLMLAAGITHLVMPSWDSFADFSAYTSLLQQAGELHGPVGESFLARVVGGREWPQWLRPVHYAIPRTFGLHGAWVRIFEVCPEQTPFEAARSLGVYFAEAGDFERAVQALEEAHALNPADPDIPRWINGLRAKRLQRQRLPAPSAP